MRQARSTGRSLIPYSYMKVVILCSGKVTWLREETEFRPKPKLVAALARKWQEGGVPRLHTPLDVCDHLPVSALAAEYSNYAATVRRAGAGAISFRRPSGWVESVEAFSHRVAREFGRLSGASYAVASEPKTIATAPAVRRNSAHGAFVFPAEVESAFWREWMNFYFTPLSAS